VVECSFSASGRLSSLARIFLTSVPAWYARVLRRQGWIQPRALDRVIADGRMAMPIVAPH
jgi:hypothetical protein